MIAYLNNITRYNTLLLFLCLFFSFDICGQYAGLDHLSMGHLSIEQGLSNNSVRCIYQDHQGFLWLGTYDGLSRYDGYSFKVFRNKLNDTSSLPHNYIYAIHEDRCNHLWVGTGQGLSIYNSVNESFSPAYFRVYEDGSRHRISANVNTLASDEKGNLLIGTNGWGLLAKKADEETAVQVPFRNQQNRTEAYYHVQGLTVDKWQRAWLFIGGVGLCRFDIGTQTINVVNTTLRAATCLKADPDTDCLWIGSAAGLYQYMIDSNTFTAHYQEGPGALSSNRIVCFSFDRQQNLWIGTEGNGISILYKQHPHFDYLLPGENKNNLSSESVFAIHADQENRLWIGTLKGGINIIDWQKSRFQTFSHSPLTANSLVNNFVSSFCEDKHKQIWIGSDGGGISVWNRSANQFRSFIHRPSEPGSLSHNSISCIREDYQGNIWAASFGGGINRYNTATGNFDHYACINQHTGEENKYVWLLFEDSERNLWASTFSNGKLYHFNRGQNRFEVFDQQLNDLIALTEDHNGILWAGNSHQLICIDKQDKVHHSYEIGKPVRAIFEDHTGRCWIGTEGGGLVLFDRQMGKITACYSDEDGLCNNAVLNILEDEQGQLWMSTFNGLSRFNPDTRVFTNFYQSDGLQSNQFSYNAAYRLSSGELLFGGIAGFNMFSAGHIQPRLFMPPLAFTNIRINNQSLKTAAAYIAGSDSGAVNALRIPFNEAVLTVSFTALEYTSPDKIKYAYYLEGLDKAWNYTGNVRTINYNNLREGSYVLRIKSTNAEGVWNRQEARLTVTVLPPWYRTLWAYSLYGGLAAFFIIAYYRYRQRQTRLRYAVKLAQLNAENEKEINEKRQTLFTHVAHEFRTPLTLIINPIRDMLSKEEQSGKKLYTGELNLVYRNARRLLSLVDQLLLFRKAEEQADQLKIARLNLYKLCHEVFLCFVQQARSRHIDYTYTCDNENLGVYGDREKMEIIFFNLLSNAVKYTAAGGHISLEVTETEHTVTIQVTDNGTGMPADAALRLFEKFYQVKQPHIPVRAGFGIGLYLVKHSVDAHKGKIQVETAPGKGSCFTVELYKGKAHFGLQEVSEQKEDAPVLLEELADITEVESAVPAGNGLESVVSDRGAMLVVDDDKAMREYIAGIFRGRFILYEAASAEEGLALARKYLPEIIICDVVMADMNGIELCNLVKQSPALRHIPVILLTGSTSPDSKLKGVAGGADDYMTKPFEKELLIARVDGLLKSRENLQQYFYNEITHQDNFLNISQEYKEFLEQCIAIVDRNIDNEAFNLHALAMELGMSHSKLYRKIKAVSGLSANAFIRFIRLRKAAELFIDTNYNVSETAFYVGIKDVKYFREQFQKTFGMNPSEYIEKYRKTFGKTYKLNEKTVKQKDT